MASSDEEDWMKASVTRKQSSRSGRPNKRSKVLGLEDLLKENDLEKERLRNRLRSRDLESSDDDDDSGDELDDHGQLEGLLKKCANELGDDSILREPPKWGEVVFGAQKEAPGLDQAQLDSVKWIIQAANSLASETVAIPAVYEAEGEKLLLDLLTEDWVSPLIIHAGSCVPGLLHWFFSTMAYSKQKDVHRAASKLICQYFSKNVASSSEGTPVWLPNAEEFINAFHCYGYQNAQPVDPATGERGPPSNFSSLLRCLLAFCENRHLQESESEKLLLMLAQFLLDRELLPYFPLIQDCIEALINYKTDNEWLSCLPSLVKSFASVSRELVNVLHVLGTLRGAPQRINHLRREIALELLSNINNRKVDRVATDVFSGLENIDPKGSKLDFVQLYYHLNVADMWLRHEPSFRNDEKGFGSWMSILRGLSVRIYCGDYRPFANKVRNRAAFLLSVYSDEEFN